MIWKISSIVLQSVRLLIYGGNFTTALFFTQFQHSHRFFFMTKGLLSQLKISLSLPSKTQINVFNFVNRMLSARNSSSFRQHRLGIALFYSF